MTVDFHTHVFSPDLRERREEYAARDRTFGSMYSGGRGAMATAAELIGAMDRAGVELSVVMGIGWSDRDTATEANDYVMEAVELFPSRLVGLCSVNPAWGNEAVAELNRCAAAGVSGIGELHPDTQGFDIADEEVMSPVMDAALRLGLPVLIHSSEPVGHLYPGKGKTTPDKLYAFIRNFPDNTIVCAHWGGGLPFYALMPEVAESLKNVYFDTAASPFLYRQEVFSAVIGIHGSDRLLFGSDYPLIPQRRSIEQIESALISDEARMDVLDRNARRLLGIPSPSMGETST